MKPTEPPTDISRIEFEVLSYDQLVFLARRSLSQIVGRFQPRDQRREIARICTDLIWILELK